MVSAEHALPLAATVVSGEIFHGAFSPPPPVALFHGPILSVQSFLLVYHPRTGRLNWSGRVGKYFSTHVFVRYPHFAIGIAGLYLLSRLSLARVTLLSRMITRCHIHEVGGAAQLGTSPTQIRNFRRLLRGVGTAGQVTPLKKMFALLLPRGREVGRGWCFKSTNRMVQRLPVYLIDK
ncbi:hypothetical protein BDN67DRAFT_965848 [Paxillus ammoniavirescens]|nr:hypothetical protein BDN67DRAFT_965848 [Paxillus ammoniavirescens]